MCVIISAVKSPTPPPPSPPSWSSRPPFVIFLPRRCQSCPRSRPGSGVIDWVNYEKITVEQLRLGCGKDTFCICYIAAAAASIAGHLVGGHDRKWTEQFSRLILVIARNSPNLAIPVGLFSRLVRPLKVSLIKETGGSDDLTIIRIPG